MQKCPGEFSDTLTPYGLRILSGEAKNVSASFRNANGYFRLLTDVIDAKFAAGCLGLLDRRLYPHLTKISRKIPEKSISNMTRAYGEALGKTLHVKTAFFQRKTSQSYKIAEETRLLEMMRSRSFTTFAEAVTGFRLRQDVELQALCYEHGDYVGPHTDHYPEHPELRNGYIDIHLMFSNSAVDHHWLVYQEKNHLSKILNVNIQGGIAVYRLPFWHYTTPLVGIRGCESTARRWVLLGTFRLAHE